MRTSILPFILLAPAAASAQIFQDPGAPPTAPGTPPNPYGPPGTALPGAPQPAPPSIHVEVTPPSPQPQKPAEDTSVYLGGPTSTKAAERFEGAETPEVHVVQKGDTLWDICTFYFNNPWKWPEIWGLNPAITNPHWIYPGDLVRLQAGGGGQAPASAPATAPSAPTAEQPASPTTAEQPTMVKTGGPRTASGVELRQLAFVPTEDLKLSAKIVGATEEQTMLSFGDHLYIEYPEGHPPQVGQTYSVYAPQRDLVHPQTHQKIGAYVLVRGEVKILEVKKGKPALGLVTAVTSHGSMERGERVGTLKTRLRQLEPVPADRSLEGVIVGIIEPDQLIGEWEVAFLDRGRDDGVKPGNQMLVVRRGDAHPQSHAITAAGQDDRRFPDHYIGTVMVVDVGKTTSLGLMTRTDQEVLVGDHVLMRKP